MMMSSETSPPLSITFFAARPSGVPALTAARSMSPVEICGIPYASLMNVAWVPLPAPGGPSRINRMVVTRLEELRLHELPCRFPPVYRRRGS